MRELQRGRAVLGIVGLAYERSGQGLGGQVCVRSQVLAVKGHKGFKREAVRVIYVRITSWCGLSFFRIVYRMSIL